MSNQCQVEPSVGVEVPEGHNLSLGNVGQYVGGGVRLQQGEANAQQLAVRGGALSRNWSVCANTVSARQANFSYYQHTVGTSSSSALDST